MQALYMLRTVFFWIERKATSACLLLASVILAVIASLGLWQVVSRFVLMQPSTWTEEVMRRLLIWAVMLGVVVAFREGAMVSVDLMRRYARGWWGKVVRGIIAIVTLVFLGVLVKFGIDLTMRVQFQTFASIPLSMSWAYAALPVGAGLSMIAVLAQWMDPRDSSLNTQQ